MKLRDRMIREEKLCKWKTGRRRRKTGRRWEVRVERIGDIEIITSKKEENEEDERLEMKEQEI